MTQDTLAELRNSSPSLLTDVVRKQQRSPTFGLLDWSVTPLSHEKIMDTTGGLYCPAQVSELDRIIFAGYLAGWVTLAEFSLDRADEARQLMAKLFDAGTQDNLIQD